MSATDGDFAISIAARLRKLYLDACGVLADMENHDFDWQGPFWTASAQCRTALRFGVLSTALRASNLMNEPAFRHEIAKAVQP